MYSGVSDNNEGEDEDAGTPATKNATPEERFLRRDSDGLLVLGPLPAEGGALTGNIAIALHKYLTQQWSKPVIISCDGF